MALVSDVVVTVGATAPTTNDNEVESANPTELVALKTKPVVVAVTVGVPEIMPPDDNDSPAGSVPD